MPLALSGPALLGLCAAQLAAGTLKTVACWLPVFLIGAAAQLGAAGLVAFHTLSAALDALGGGASDPPLSTLSAYLYTGAAAAAVLVTATDVGMTAAYVLRGVPTDDPGAAVKVLVVFSMPGVLLVVAALTLHGWTRLGDVNVSELSDRLADTATICCAAGLAVAAVGTAVVTALVIFNVASRVGNRRFAAAWVCLLFLTLLPSSVALGVSAIAGWKTDRLGFAYIAASVLFPLMSCSFMLTKESFVLEHCKNGEECAAP